VKIVEDDDKLGVSDALDVLEGILRVVELVEGAEEVGFVSVRNSSIREETVLNPDETDAMVLVRFLTTTS